MSPEGTFNTLVSRDAAWEPPRENPRRGYISLNFYNLFWIFTLCSVIGLILETFYIFMLWGVFESRAGLVIGPFSPIYGCGAVLFTIFLNRFWDKNIVITFLVAMLIGMGLEFCTSWLMETYFGLESWDYTGTFGSISGRTNLAFGLIWGALGVVWIRVLLPLVLYIVNLIPFRWHITFTTLMTLFMACNIAVTLLAFDRAGQRKENIPPSNEIMRLCDYYFDDKFMAERFANMSTDTDIDAWA